MAIPQQLNRIASQKSNLMGQHSWYPGVIGGLFLTVLMLSAALSLGTSHPSGIFILLVAAIPVNTMLINSILSREVRGYTFILSLFTNYIVILPGMLHCAKSQFPFYNLDYDDADVSSAASIIALFAWSYGISSSFGYRRDYVGVTDRHLWSLSLNQKNIMLVIGVLIAVALTGFFVLGGPRYFFSKLGDVGTTFSSRATDPLALALDSLVRIAGFIPLALSIILFIGSRRGSGWKAAVVLIGATTFLLVNYPLNITRFLLAGYGIAILYLLFDLRKVFAKSIFAASFCAALILLFPTLSLLSRGGRGTTMLQNPLERFATSGDFDGFQSIINIFILVRESGLSWGSHLLSALLSFVPRQIWADKPLPTGVEAARFAGYSFSNISAPLPGELYRDFGWIGVSAGGWLLAKGFISLERQMEKAIDRGRPITLLVHGVALGFLPIILRGSLLGVSSSVMSVVILTAVVAVICQRRHLQVPMAESSIRRHT